jgi:predicted nucleic-acid-binding protein
MVTVKMTKKDRLLYQLKDNKKFYKEAEALFNEAFSGKKKILIMHSVIVEVVYVLLWYG